MHKFKSKLPGVIKAAKEKKIAKDHSQQTSINPYLVQVDPKEPVLKYSDAAFHEAAIEWLISTDQVSFDFVSFQQYFNIFPSHFRCSKTKGSGI